MSSRFELGCERSITSPDLKEDLLTYLNRTFGPTVLLVFEAIHVNGKLCRSLHFVEEDKSPALQLGPVAKVHVFCERVVVPAASIHDT